MAVMSPNVPGWRVLTSDRTRGVLSSLVWTPDGSRIYFDRLSNVPEGIFSVSVFGEDTRPIPGERLYAATVERRQPAGCHAHWRQCESPPSSILARRDATPPRAPERLPELASGRIPPSKCFPTSGKRSFTAILPTRWTHPTISTSSISRPVDLRAILCPVSRFRRRSGSSRWPPVRSGCFLVLPAGDLHRIVSVPRHEVSPDRVQTLLTLSERPLYIDVGADGAIYADQIAQPNELICVCASNATSRVYASLSAWASGCRLPSATGGC